LTVDSKKQGAHDVRPFCFGDAMTALASEDPRSVSELFAAAVEGDYDDDSPWGAVAALRLRGTQDVFELASEYCVAKDPKARARGLDVLAQLGAGEETSQRPYLQQCVSMAIRLLEDPEPIVAHSAAWALAHLGTNEAVAALLPLKQHPEPGVRHAVANGAVNGTGPERIVALMELMADRDEDVRDWATFGLGSLCSEDSPEIREALRARLTDSFEPARSEAVWGLALRKDPTGLRTLLDRLEAETWQQGDKNTAQEILDLTGEAPVERLCEGLRILIT
jgi:HEAT repeat protein